MSKEKAPKLNMLNKPEERKILRLLKKPKRGLVHILSGRTGLVVLLLFLQMLILFFAFRFLEQYVPFWFGGSVAFSAVMLIYILNTKGSPGAKLTWCIIIALMPVFGVCMYVYAKLEIGHRSEQKLLQRVEKESVAYIPHPDALMAQLKETEPELYRLAHYMEKQNGFPVYENTSVTYFPLGEDKFEALLQQLEQAKKFIFLEYFILEEGYMWGAVLNILAKKVTEGVEVRLLYDGTCTFRTLPHNYPKQLQALGIQCKAFAPFTPLMSTHYNYRDHRKIVVIDGHTGFTGGVNLSDEYINRKVLHGHWKDTAIMLQGDAVYGLTYLFLQMWNVGEKERIYEPYLTATAAHPKPEAEGYVIPYGDRPLDNEQIGEMVYLDIINTARDYVYIMSPYLILDNEMITALTFAAKRGVDVKLILPHIPDKKYVYYLAKTHYRELTEAGVKIYEYTPGFVHAKVFVSDDTKAVVGTINLDYRSLSLHFECAAYLYKVPAIKDIIADYADTLQKCQAVTMETIQKEHFFAKLAGAILKVVAPLL